MRIYQSVALIALALISAQANAQRGRGNERAGTWEAGVHVTDTSSVRVDEGHGTSLNVDGAIGYGFTGAYNFTNKLAAGLDLNWGSPDYQATLVPDGGGAARTLNASLDASTIHLKGIFNILDGGFTPFVEVGAGWTYVDSNIVNGLPTTGCWFDPWFGYVCANFYDTYSNTQTSYSGAVGLRWEMGSDFVVRGSYGVLEIDSDRGKNLSLDTIQIDFAWRF